MTASLEYRYSLLGQDGKKYILSHHLENIAALMAFMHEALYTKDLFYKTHTAGRKTISPLGKHLRSLYQYTSVYNPNHHFHPAISFFLEEYRKHQIHHLPNFKAHEIVDGTSLMSDVFDSFVKHLRTQATKTKVKKRISDWESKFTKNEKSTLKLEKSIFDRHARVAVIRLDFSYRKATFSPDEIYGFMQAEYTDGLTSKAAYWSEEDDLAYHTQQEGRVSLEELQRDRARLFANMKGKPSLFGHLIGYVWRIECSPKAGFHLHVALLFNGAQIEHHEWLAQQIGEYWNQDITKGQGRFHNCNMEWKRTSPNYGLGIVNHYDNEKRSILRRKVLGYLCKNDQLVQVTPYPGCNLFGTGLTHRNTTKGRGRPRIRGDANSNQPGLPPQ
ncbi:MAG: inovirus-type Gp2 protein [Aquabacterium sp.]|uniref:YagK/YfjJ domain-containing protein n=1 Tax=Aquabacterium sp. TaxID=1872578 RepID=UPI0025BC6560|nr:inovirus-type Gp2 protein [Aquabacterium sp.]MBI5925872.1 inovirus-type Gp2 protein [Aquabacterium sp.]